MNGLLFKLLIIFSITDALIFHTVLKASMPKTSLPIITRATKSNLPPDVAAEARNIKLSIFKPKDGVLPFLYLKYPSGSTLFPKNPDVASKFDVMINAIKSNSSFIEFFRKIHTDSLNQLYLYLMKIYTNFNLTNPGTSQASEFKIADVTEYLIDEATYATSEKKLIMNHLINLIQAQFGGTIVAYVPTTPPEIAVSLGKIFVQNDYGLNLDDFAKPQSSPNQAAYFKFLQQYMDFFKTYTSYLSKADSNGINEYYKMAQFINKYLNQPDAIKTMDPPMFLYNTESMRSIQFIPFISKSIPKNTKPIPWAPVIVNAAVKQMAINGHPVAYFRNAAGKITHNKDQAKSLHMLTDLGNSLFEEELLAQPAWLNSQEGSIRILSACLGNLSALVGTGILDSTTEKIIQKGMKGQ